MEKDKEEFWDTLKNPPPKKTAADYLREIKKRHDKYIEKEEEDKNAYRRLRESFRRITRL